MGVGIGEAGGVAPSYALISDFYPRERRARALAFFSLGIPIGSALGVFFGGWIASQLDWRSAFLIVGLAGLPAPCWSGCAFPSRCAAASTAPRARRSDPAPPFAEVVATAARERRASGCSPSAPRRARSSATA